MVENERISEFLEKLPMWPDRQGWWLHSASGGPLCGPQTLGSHSGPGQRSALPGSS